MWCVVAIIQVAVPFRLSSLLSEYCLSKQNSALSKSTSAPKTPQQPRVPSAAAAAAARNNNQKPTATTQPPSSFSASMFPPPFGGSNQTGGGGGGGGGASAAAAGGVAGGNKGGAPRGSFSSLSSSTDLLKTPPFAGMFLCLYNIFRIAHTYCFFFFS